MPNANHETITKYLGNQVLLTAIIITINYRNNHIINY